MRGARRRLKAAVERPLDAIDRLTDRTDSMTHRDGLLPREEYGKTLSDCQPTLASMIGGKSIAIEKQTLRTLSVPELLAEERTSISPSISQAQPATLLRPTQQPPVSSSSSGTRSTRSCSHHCTRTPRIAASHRKDETLGFLAIEMRAEIRVRALSGVVTVRTDHNGCKQRSSMRPRPVTLQRFLNTRPSRLHT